MGLHRVMAAVRGGGSNARRVIRRAWRRLAGPPGPDLAGGSPTPSSRYFVHVPKTAGMTVKEFLRRCRPTEPGPHRLFEGYFLHEVIADLDGARRCSLFAGHYHGFLDPLLGRATRKATLLRDPVERAISHFLHARRDPLLPFHEEFRDRSLAEVLARPHLRSFAVNVQARILAAVADDPSWFDHTMQVRVRPCDDDELLARARAGLALIEVVGLHERLPEFLRDLAAAWSLRAPEEIPKVNVAGNRGEIAIRDEEREMLRDLNRVDATLYAEAAARAASPATGKGFA